MGIIEKLERLKAVVGDEVYSQAIDDVITTLNQEAEVLVGEVREAKAIVTDLQKALPRPEIMAFAEAMEKEMQRHDAEKGDSWRQLEVEKLFRKIAAHAIWMKKAIDDSDNLIWDECAISIANYAMMIWNKAKGE